jgi:hypothetical protein
MCCREAMPGDATVVAMRRLVSTLFRAALVIGALAIVRAVLLDRAPRRELHRDEPVIGSLDTWPAVPRKPQG